jgi:hypothetical protein
MAFHFSKILYFGSALQVAHMRMRKCGVTTRQVDRRGSGHLAGYRVYLARVGVRVRFLNPVKTLTPSTGVAGFSGIFSHSRFLFHFFFANLLFFFRSCYIFIADRHGRARPHNRWPRQRDLSTRLPAPYPPFRRRPLPRGPGPLGPTTRHLPTATRATTRGEDKTRRRHPHAPHRAPRRLAAAPTTNGHDGDDTWRGQNTPTPPARAASCPSRLRAPCPSRLHAPCPIDGGSGVSSPLHVELFASSTNASDSAMVASSAPPASSTLAGLSVGAGTACALRCIPPWTPIASPWPVPLAALDASPCATQWITHSIGLPRATQQRIAVHDPAVDRCARRSRAVDRCAQRSSRSPCMVQQQIAARDAAAARGARRGRGGSPLACAVAYPA